MSVLSGICVFVCMQRVAVKPDEEEKPEASVVTVVDFPSLPSPTPPPLEPDIIAPAPGTASRNKQKEE